MYVEFSENTKEYLAKEGFDLEFGARPLRRAIQKKVEDKLSEEMLKGTIKAGDHVLVDMQDDQLEFKVK